jgi:cytosine deaminase
MDLVLRNARLGGGVAPVDVAIDRGRIAAIEQRLDVDAEIVDVGGRLLAPGFVETHIHLDKSCLLERCRTDEGSIDQVLAEVTRVKREFTPDDVYARGARTLEKCIAHGTTHMRTHLEVDPGIGLRGLQGVLQLVRDYRWAIDVEICVFPQEGLLNNPGTDELLVEALSMGCRAIGAAPYTDSDPRGQIDRVFELAQQFDVDVDMHLDFGATPDGMDVGYVCEKTEAAGLGGRVTVGHVTKLSLVPPTQLLEIGRRLANAGVAVTVLPATDLFLMGREADHRVVRGVTPVHRLLEVGVNCSLSTNNVLNPFTPFGDCSLVRMANLYANVAQLGRGADLAECFELVTSRSARLLRLEGYGVEVGAQADVVVLDCQTPLQAVTEVVQPVFGLKRGRRTFTREPVVLHKP